MKRPAEKRTPNLRISGLTGMKYGSQTPAALAPKNVKIAPALLALRAEAGDGSSGELEELCVQQAHTHLK